MPRLASLAADSEAILAAFGAALTEAGVTLPERVYVNPGSLVAWDEPQLTLSVVRIGMGEPGTPAGTSLVRGQFHQSVSYGLLWLITVASLTDAGLPATDDLDSDGDVLLTAMSILWSAAVQLRLSGALAPGNASVVIGPAATVGPEGALAGVALPIEISLL